MFDNLLESSHRDDSNKWSNIGFGQEITELVLIKINFTHLIWSSDYMNKLLGKGCSLVFDAFINILAL